MNTIDLCIIVGYLVLTLVIGLYQGRKVKTMKDYAIADRNYSTPIMVAAVAATAIGGATTIGVSEKVFSTGIIFLFAYFGDAVYKLLIAKFIAPRMSEFEGLFSVGDIMGKIYGTKIKIITGIAGTLYSVGTLAAQISALGYLFYYFTGLDHVWGILIGAGAAVLYSTFGGIRAVTITDVIQFAILIIIIPITCSIGLSYVGGFEILIQKIPPSHFDFSSSKILEYLGLFIIFSLPLLSPAITQRLLMSKNTDQMIQTMKVTAAIEIPFLIVVALIGLIALVIGSNIEAQMALPHVIATILPVGLKGLAIAGMLAVIMSSADSFLNSASILFVHDVINPIRNYNNKNSSDVLELKLAKFYTFVFGLIAIGIAMSFDSIMDIVIMARYFWGPVIIAPLILGIFKFKIVRSAIYVGMVGGLVTFFIGKFFITPFYKINSLVPSIIINILLVFIWHYYKKKEFCFFNKSNSNKNNCRKELYVLTKKFLSSLTSKNFLEALRERINEYGAEYVLFGVFCTLNYIVPFFMWSTNPETDSLILFFRLTGAFLCFLLIIKDHLWDKFEKYFPIYWYGTLLFCFPFFTTYMLLINNFKLFWIFNSVLSIFILNLLVDSLSFVVILITGIIFALLIYTFLQGEIIYPQDFETIFLCIYMFIFSAVVGMVFSRKKEHFNKIQIESLKSMAGAIAHEMRTPLANVMLKGRILERSAESMEKALQESSERSTLTLKDEVKGLSKLSQSLLRVTKGTQNLIDLLLNNLSQNFENLPQKPLSMKQCLEHTLEEFSFKPEHQSKVHVDMTSDFEFNGNLDLIMHVFFNLLKNSLYFIQASKKERCSFNLPQMREAIGLFSRIQALALRKVVFPICLSLFILSAPTAQGLDCLFVKRPLKAWAARSPWILSWELTQPLQSHCPKTIPNQSL